MHLLGLSLIALLCNTFLVCYSFSGGKLCVAISIDISLWASFNIIKPCLSLEKFQFLPHGFCLWCYYNYNSLYLFQHVHLGLLFCIFWIWHLSQNSLISLHSASIIFTIDFKLFNYGCPLYLLPSLTLPIYSNNRNVLYECQHPLNRQVSKLSWSKWKLRTCSTWKLCW